MIARLKSLIELKEIVKNLKKNHPKIVFTNGCFDILHIGHLYYLEKARSKGDFLIVAINSNTSVRKLKGKNRPLVDELERAEIIAALDCVSWVTIFKEDTPAKVITELRPDVLVKGGDYCLDEIVGRDFVESYKGEVVAIPLLKGYSSTNLIKKVMEKYG